MASLLGWLGNRLASYLTKTIEINSTGVPTDSDRLRTCLQPGDVLLIEGNTRVSTAIKYLTQSTWSHAALFVGNHLPQTDGNAGHCFIEVDMVAGVRSAGLEEYAHLHTRICHPVNLSQADCQKVTAFAIARLGNQYDLRNVVDLARYLLPTPPVPVRFRRRMIALGSGDPTRAICSTLIAQAFQSIRYPILPIVVDSRNANRADCPDCIEEILRVRHHSLFAPRDFDVSPYFQIIKPTLAENFDYTALRWHDRP
ncbi:MAG: lipo-like protein [Rugosibacter sp.]|nr:MAG: lipo-like protein [Rugosibacter sp.]TBR11791.1 MAG: lipo-like protein [Rugosibacter sp.]